MSIVSDHLSDDGCRGMYSAAPDAVVYEVMRLAGLLATARVRRYAVSVGKGGPQETTTNTDKRVSLAEAALKNYVERIV